MNEGREVRGNIRHMMLVCPCITELSAQRKRLFRTVEQLLSTILSQETDLRTKLCRQRGKSVNAPTEVDSQYTEGDYPVLTTLEWLLPLNESKENLLTRAVGEDRMEEGCWDLGYRGLIPRKLTELFPRDAGADATQGLNRELCGGLVHLRRIICRHLDEDTLEFREKYLDPQEEMNETAAQDQEEPEVTFPCIGIRCQRAAEEEGLVHRLRAENLLCGSCSQHRNRQRTNARMAEIVPVDEGDSNFRWLTEQLRTLDEIKEEILLGLEIMRSKSNSAEARKRVKITVLDAGFAFLNKTGDRKPHEPLFHKQLKTLCQCENSNTGALAVGPRPCTTCLNVADYRPATAQVGVGCKPCAGCGQHAGACAPCNVQEAWPAVDRSVVGGQELCIQCYVQYARIFRQCDIAEGVSKWKAKRRDVALMSTNEAVPPPSAQQGNRPELVQAGGRRDLRNEVSNLGVRCHCPLKFSRQRLQDSLRRLHEMDSLTKVKWERFKLANKVALGQKGQSMSSKRTPLSERIALAGTVAGSLVQEVRQELRPNAEQHWAEICHYGRHSFKLCSGAGDAILL